jgi:hypothetical protein
VNVVGALLARRALHFIHFCFVCLYAAKIVIRDKLAKVPVPEGVKRQVAALKEAKARYDENKIALAAAEEDFDFDD